MAVENSPVCQGCVFQKTCDSVLVPQNLQGNKNILSQLECQHYASSETVFYIPEAIEAGTKHEVAAFMSAEKPMVLTLIQAIEFFNGWDTGATL